MLPAEAVTQFKDLYRQTYDIELNDAEASARANNLMRLYQAVLEKPVAGRVYINEKNEEYDRQNK